eukprot:gene11293-biopygen19873
MVHAEGSATGEGGVSPDRGDGAGGGGSAERAASAEGRDGSVERVTDAPGESGADTQGAGAGPARVQPSFGGGGILSVKAV